MNKLLCVVLQIHDFFLLSFQRMQTQYGNGVAYGNSYDSNRQLVATSELTGACSPSAALSCMLYAKMTL